MYECLDNKKHVVSVFIDFSKAFDTVNHSILLDKLELYGVRNVALKWFTSYLSNRIQGVRVGSTTSGMSDVVNGVPQGSVLGPLLYLVYSNDISVINGTLKSTLFADDTTLTVAGSEIGPLLTSLNCELVKFTNWTLSNRLALNANKTNVILFSNRIAVHDINSCVVLGNSDLDFQFNTRFLGVEIDSKLKFCSHISLLSSKLSKTVGIFYKLSNKLSEKTLVNLYYNLFYPYIIYCNLVWGDTYSVHLNTIDLLQKRIVRVITGSNYLAHTGPLFHRTKILKLSDVHTFLLGTYMYSHISSFSTPTHTITTRQSEDPIVNYTRLALSRHSVSYVGPKLWCNLPNNIKSSSSLSVFKKKFKDYLLNSYI